MRVNTVHFKVLSLRDSDIVQDQLDVFNLLQDVPGSLQKHLQNPWASEQDFKYIKAGSTNFWRAAASDMPGPLAQTSMIDPNRFHRGQTSKDFLSTKQCLGRHPDFKNLMLTTDNMTCVSRNDGEYMNSSREAGLTQTGVILTMLSSKGLNYLNNARTYIPWPNVMLSPDESVLGSLVQTQWPPFRHVETASENMPIEDLSHNKHVEMFLFSMIMGFHTSPFVRGFEMSGLEEAYEQIVQEMVSV